MFRKLKEKQLHKWGPSYARNVWDRRTKPRPKGTRHLLVAICDHYEPYWGKCDDDRANRRVARWEEDYPQFMAPYQDADGYYPRHSFFYPGEEYTPDILDSLGKLTRNGWGEVEVHLHHDGDTEETLREKLLDALEKFRQHGHISRDSQDASQYAFIHGNWALANGRSDGKWCGVDSELKILKETGCYADLTFPSAPHPTQPPVVNEIFWPARPLDKRRAYDESVPARVGQRHDSLLMITGPLCLTRREGSMGVRIESSALDAGDPPSPFRLKRWVEQNIHIEGRPEWTFLKLHTHGAPEKNATMFFGAQMREFHLALQKRYNDGTRWQLHYVTAREMYNIALAAMDGKEGNPGQFRDYEIQPPPVAAA